MWIPIILLIVVILILRNVSVSHKAASIPMTCKSAPVHGSTPTAGDSFCSGRSFVAGVSEPNLIHCCHLSVGVKTLSGLPTHITLPATQPPLPPPLKIIAPQPITRTYSTAVGGTGTRGCGGDTCGLTRLLRVE